MFFILNLQNIFTHIKIEIYNHSTDAIEKMRIMEKAVKEKFEEYKHIVNEYKKAIWNLKSERDVLQERLTNSVSIFI